MNDTEKRMRKIVILAIRLSLSIYVFLGVLIGISYT